MLQLKALPSLDIKRARLLQHYQIALSPWMAILLLTLQPLSLPLKYYGSEQP